MLVSSWPAGVSTLFRGVVTHQTVLCPAVYFKSNVDEHFCMSPCNFKTSRPALGGHPVGTGVIYRGRGGVKRPGREVRYFSHVMPRLRMSGVCTFTSPVCIHGVVRGNMAVFKMWSCWQR